MVEKRGRMTKEISAFIVEKGTPGFSFGTKEKKMGIRGSSTYELIFTDCRIPKENMLGAAGQGLWYRNAYTGWRTYRYRCAGSWSWQKALLERTIAYVKERKQFGTCYRTVPEYTVPAC